MKQEQELGKIAQCPRVNHAGTAIRSTRPFRPRSLDACDGGGTKGRGGGGLLDEDTGSMQNRLEEFMAEDNGGFGSSYTLVMWARLEKGTRDGYVGAMHAFLRHLLTLRREKQWKAGYCKSPKRGNVKGRLRSYCRPSDWQRSRRSSSRWSRSPIGYS